MLSRTSEYALRAMIWLAKQGGSLVKTEEIAQEVKAPEAYLAKILQSLHKAGLLQSSKGLKGGYALAKPPQEISLFDVINVVDPCARIVKCPLGIQDHEKLCPLHQKLDDVHAEMERLYGTCFLSDLVKDKKSSPLCISP